MKKNIVRKGLVVGMIFLFIGLSVIPLVGSITRINQIRNKDEISSKSTREGDILYVGGSGPSNYTRIQDAIDNASDGDTVFVYDESSTYYENILVTKSILLKGEDKNTTTIEGIENVLVLQADNINISGFTIQCSHQSHHGNGIDIRGIKDIIITQNIIDYYDCGIYCENTNDISIIENIFQDVYAKYGMWLLNCNTAMISDNLIIGYNQIGIQLEACIGINIFNNEIRKTWCGIYDSDYSSDVHIYNNYLINNEHGMILYMKNLQLYNNIIQNSKWGLACGGEKAHVYRNTLKDNKIDIFKGNNKFYENNFINDTITFDHYLGNSLLIKLLKFKNFRNFILTLWFKFHRIPIDVDRNYWENHSSDLPKRIEGDLIWFTGYPPFEEEHSVSWYIYDDNPASEPYEI